MNRRTALTALVLGPTAAKALVSGVAFFSPQNSPLQQLMGDADLVRGWDFGRSPATVAVVEYYRNDLLIRRTISGIDVPFSPTRQPFVRLKFPLEP